MTADGAEPARICMSVVVPVFNRLGLLRDTVESLRTQSLTEAEFILVDDRSGEDTWNYLTTLPSIDSRFTIMRKPDHIPRGSQLTRNLGLDACTGEGVTFLDSDDILTSTCLEDRYAFLTAHPDADIIVGRQSIWNNGSGQPCVRVNVERPDVTDIERFVALASPLDVPWVTGGVTIRTSELKNANVRWRPQFLWDDVAFHFECLAAGMASAWMPTRDNESDFYYRLHSEEHFGATLFLPKGIRTTLDMLVWMRITLSDAGLLSDPLEMQLTRNFFHTCFLRAVDSGHFALSRELLENAIEKALVTPTDAVPMGRYGKGRALLHRSPRLTYYWNRITEDSLRARFSSDTPSTFATIATA